MKRNSDLTREAEEYAQRYSLDSRCLEDLLAQEEHIVREIVKSCTFDAACRNPSAIVTKQIQKIKHFGGGPSHHLKGSKNKGKGKNNFGGKGGKYFDGGGKGDHFSFHPSSGMFGNGGNMNSDAETMNLSQDASDVNEEPPSMDELFRSLQRMKKCKLAVPFDDISQFIQQYNIPEDIHDILEKCPDGVIELLEADERLSEGDSSGENRNTVIAVLGQFLHGGELQHKCNVRVFVRDVQGIADETKQLILGADRGRQLKVLVKFGAAVRKNEGIGDNEVQQVLTQVSSCCKTLESKQKLESCDDFNKLLGSLERACSANSNPFFGGDHHVLEREIEAFCMRNKVDEGCCNALKNTHPSIVENVISEGDLAGEIRNPSAMVLSRIKMYRDRGHRLPGVSKSQMRQFMDQTPRLDENAAKAILEAPPELQRLVIEQGPVNTVDNPSAIVMARLGRARKLLNQRERSPYRSPSSAPCMSPFRSTPNVVHCTVPNMDLDNSANKVAPPQLPAAVDNVDPELIAQIDEFVSLNRLDAVVRDVLIRAPDGMIECVMRDGAFPDNCRDPSAVVAQRVRRILTEFQWMPSVQCFIRENSVDDKAADLLLTSPLPVIQSVVGWGRIDGQNTSAVLQSRIRNAKQQRGSGPGVCA